MLYNYFTDKGWLKKILSYFLESEVHQVSFNEKKIYSLFIMRMISVFILIVTCFTKFNV